MTTARGNSHAAALIVGSTAGRRVRRKRLRLLVEWMRPQPRTCKDGFPERLVGGDSAVVGSAERTGRRDRVCHSQSARTLWLGPLTGGQPHAPIAHFG